MGYNKELSDSLSLLAKFALSQPKIIKKILRVANYNDEPKVFTYFADYEVDGKLEYGSSGTSFNRKRALVKALGEAIERYCLNRVDEEKLIAAKISDLQLPFLDPRTIPSFSRTQLQKSSYGKFSISQDTNFRWIEGYSYSEQLKVFVPAQLVYTNYQLLDKEPHIRFSISTGAAAHTSLKQALYAGICEVVERDSFMIYYLNMMAPPMIDLQAIRNDEIKYILHNLDRYKLELAVFDMTTDLQIPVYAAVLLDRTGNGPAVSIGLKAGFSTIDSVRGAIEETLMSRTWLRDKFIYMDKDLKLPEEIETIEQRAFFWFKLDTISYLKFLFEGKSIKKLDTTNENWETNFFDRAVKSLREHNLRFYYVDITQKEVYEAGFTVVKVFIPELYPVYFDDKYPYYGIDRLYDLPVKLGLSKMGKSESEFNSIPHPFL